jgi:hypothetical protein
MLHSRMYSTASRESSSKQVYHILIALGYVKLHRVPLQVCFRVLFLFTNLKPDKAL